MLRDKPTPGTKVKIVRPLPVDLNMGVEVNDVAIVLEPLGREYDNIVFVSIPRLTDHCNYVMYLDQLEVL